MLGFSSKRFRNSARWRGVARGTAMAGLALSVCLAAAAAAEAVQVARVTLEAASDEVVAGEPLQLSLKVLHDRDTRVEIPRLPREWGPFHVDDQAVQITDTTADGRLITQQTIVVSVYAPGTYTTPPIPVTIRRKNGSTVIETVSPIPVRSVWGEEAPACD